MVWLGNCNLPFTLVRIFHFKNVFNRCVIWNIGITTLPRKQIKNYQCSINKELTWNCTWVLVSLIPVRLLNYSTMNIWDLEESLKVLDRISVDTIQRKIRRNSSFNKKVAPEIFILEMWFNIETCSSWH